MKLNVQNKLYEDIIAQQKDIALITVPGMGLSTLLQGIKNDSNLVVFIKVDDIQTLWSNTYKTAKSHQKKFIVHAAAVKALIENKIFMVDPDTKWLSLKKLLVENKPLIESDKIYFVIDDFDKIEDELAKVMLDEIKTISDQKENKEDYYVFNSIRFVIGGCIDFQGLYPEMDPGSSPATNFCKHYPKDFLLSYNEISDFLKEKFPEILYKDYSVPFILDLTAGNIHYVEHMASWISIQLKEDSALNLDALIFRLQEEIAENKQIPLLKYCRKSWESVKNDFDCRQILIKAVRSPNIRDSSSRSWQLMRLGFLLNSHSHKIIYQVSNKIVWMYLRQRLAETQCVLPIIESPHWGLKKYNSSAYSLLFEIENTMRNYIGDVLLNNSVENGSNWKDYLNIVSERKNILEEAEGRRKGEMEDMNSGNENIEPILEYLDFPDLSFLIKTYEKYFPHDFSQNTPAFMKELNYFRRRIAHNRHITLEMIMNIEARWNQMKNLMFKKS